MNSPAFMWAKPSPQPVFRVSRHTPAPRPPHPPRQPPGPRVAPCAQAASPLREMIKRKKEINPELRVTIRADKRAKYSYVRSIMVALGGAGVPNVTFSAVDKETEPNKPKPQE